MEQINQNIWKKYFKLLVAIFLMIAPFIWDDVFGISISDKLSPLLYFIFFIGLMLFLFESRKSFMPKTIKRIAIYIIIITATVLWLENSNSFCNFGGTGSDNNCELVLIALGIILLTLAVTIIDILISIIRWVINKIFKRADKKI